MRIVKEADTYSVEGRPAPRQISRLLMYRDQCYGACQQTMRLDGGNEVNGYSKVRCFGQDRQPFTHNTGRIMD